MLRDLKLDVLAKSSERYMQITFGPLVFQDSILFVSAALANMMESQRKAFSSAILAFPAMAAFHPHAGADLELLLQKIPFPYNTMDSMNCFDLPALLPQSFYDNDLTKEACSDETYALVKHIVTTLGLTTFGDYHDVYLFTDILAYRDCMEAFRTAFFQSTGLDAVHSVSLPAAAKSAMLLATRATPVDLVSPINGGWDFMNDINANIRGGLSNIFVPHLEANNPKVPGYNPEEETTWLAYVDVNSLYPTVMCEKMPESGYEAVELSEDPAQALAALNMLLDNYTNDDEYGYMIVVDHHIPKARHDDIDFAPVCKRKVAWEELSKRQRQVKEFLGKALKDQCEKLMPYLGEHCGVGLHIKHLKFLRDRLGTDVTKVHRIWKFKQTYWLRDYIQKMARERQESSDKVRQDVLKLIMNALYGKFLQNKENYTDTKTHTNVQNWMKATWKACGRKAHFNIVQGGLDNGVELPFLGTVTTAPEKAIVLDTQRLQGWAILELTKVVMLDLHYNVFKSFYGDRAVLAFTDTDSLIYQLKTVNYLDDFEKINAQSLKQVFDLRDTGRAAPNAAMLGLAKDEAGGKDGLKTICSFVGAQAKMYSLLLADAAGHYTTVMKGKGIPKKDLKRLHKHNDFLETVMNPNVDRQVSFRAIRSTHHRVEHRWITKRGLTGDNDKVFLLGPHASRPLGHYANALAEHQKTEAQKRFEARAAAQWPNLDEDLVQWRLYLARERVEAAERKEGDKKRKAETDPDAQQDEGSMSD